MPGLRSHRGRARAERTAPEPVVVEVGCRPAGGGTAKTAEGEGGTPAALQQRYLKAVRHILAHTEDVGERFAEEARRMHYKEAPERSIRGTTSHEDALELAEEGIEVMPLLVPDALKQPVH